MEHGPVEYYEPTREFQMQRWMECEACGVLTVWREVCTGDGQVLGRIVAVPKPEIFSGAPARAFLRERASAMGKLAGVN
jgi:rRNA maturation protein Nop10